METEKFKNKIGIYEILLLYLATISISITFLLSRNAFSAFKVISFGFIGLILILIIFRPKISIKDGRFTWFLLLVLIFALVLRKSPYLYLMGGQDEGTYVNISKQYDLWGSLIAKDPFRASLSKELQKKYDENGNFIMPSISKWGRSGSDYILNFYPLHPAWMSVFGYLFGSDQRVYSLTFFSIISLISFYLIVLELTNKEDFRYRNKTVANFSLLLLALNPAHVFFSKFSVGEMISLAFNLSAFYCLIKFYKYAKENNSYNYFILVTSLLLFNALFYTRMSFFIYLPLVLILSLLVALYVNNSKLKYSLLSFFFILIFLFLFSYRYYFKYQNQLFTLLFGGRVEKMADLFFGFIPLSIYAKAFLIFIFWALILGLLIIFSQTKFVSWLKSKLLKVYVPSLIFIFLATFLKGLLDAYKLGWLYSTTYRRFDMSMHGLISTKHIPFFVVITYVSPFIFILFGWALLYFSKRKPSWYVALLLIVSTYFLFATTVFSEFVKYPYYFVRYYFSEDIPVLILTSSIFLFESDLPKKIRIFLKYATIVYFSFFSFVLLFGNEGPSLSFYKNINNTVPTSSLLVVNDSVPASIDESSRNFNLYMVGPLKFYYGYNTLVLSSAQEIFLPIFSDLTKKYSEIYLLSDVSVNDSSHFSDEKILTLDYTYFNNPIGCSKHTYEFLEYKTSKQLPMPHFLECITPPNTYITRYRNYYLYKVIH